MRCLNALGSARECEAGLHAACALGYVTYVTRIEPVIGDGLRQVVGTLVNLTRG